MSLAATASEQVQYDCVLLPGGGPGAAALCAVQMIAVPAGTGWLGRLSAWHPQRIMAKLVAGPAGVGWRWLSAWYRQRIMIQKKKYH